MHKSSFGIYSEFTCAWSCKFSIGAGSLSPRVSERNRTIAFKHANSAGSTRIDLNRQSVSCNTRISNASSCLLILFVLPLMLLQCSATENSGQFDGSNGIHHWIAFNRNSSAHDSSNKMTCNKFQNGTFKTTVIPYHHYQPRSTTQRTTSCSTLVIWLNAININLPTLPLENSEHCSIE